MYLKLQIFSTTTSRLLFSSSITFPSNSSSHQSKIHLGVKYIIPNNVFLFPKNKASSYLLLFSPKLSINLTSILYQGFSHTPPFSTFTLLVILLPLVDTSTLLVLLLPLVDADTLSSQKDSLTNKSSSYLRFYMFISLSLSLLHNFKILGGHEGHLFLLP